VAVGGAIVAGRTAGRRRALRHAVARLPDGQVVAVAKVDVVVIGAAIGAVGAARTDEDILPGGRTGDRIAVHIRPRHVGIVCRAAASASRWCRDERQFAPR